MKIQCSGHSIMILIVIILVSQYHTCSCRYINHNHHPSSNDEPSELTEQNRIITKFLPTYSQYFSTVPDHYLRRMNEIDDHRLHVVSRRIVPCGPNPLHNWFNLGKHLHLKMQLKFCSYNEILYSVYATSTISFLFQHKCFCYQHTITLG